MTDGDRQLLRYLLEDAATAEQAIGVSWRMPDGWERHETGVPRAIPEALNDTPDAFIVLDTRVDATVEAIYLEAIVRVWVPDKPGETLWP
jgi:hypothetical protein